MSLLEVRGVDVHYGPVQALRDVTLEVGEAEMVALIGANGAGKTTALRTISGVLGPSSGEIWFAGERIDGLAPYEVIERGAAHLPEGRELFADMSVLDNLRLGHWTQRKSGKFKSKADEVMSHFPILAERSSQAAGTLSGGEQQMLGVARALMSDPRLLIVDELSLGLAPKIVDQLFEILRAVNARGTSVLIVEQFVHMALANTNRAYALAKGEVVLEGTSADLAGDPELMAVYLGESSGPSSGGANGARSPAQRTKRRARPTGRETRNDRARTRRAPNVEVE
ncbi:MAG TPA: ABC transporter ATP-binding protein [Acidimicrobiia bacterium]|nr:ABC transporter ATP-binding protein [Acidimicrobiia bacterium]